MTNVKVSRDYTDSEVVGRELKKIMDKYSYELIKKDEINMLSFDHSETFDCMIPKKGRFELEIKNNKYLIDMHECVGITNVSISCDSKKQETAKKILDRLSKNSKQITVREEVSYPTGVSTLFNIIERDFEVVNTKGRQDKENIVFEYLPGTDSYIPVEGIITIKQKEDIYRILLDRKYHGKEIEISSNHSNKEKIENIFREIRAKRPESKNDESKVISVNGDFIQLSDYSWEDVGGLEEQKQKLEELVSWPLDNPELLAESGIDAPKAVLLYGPPGTGKTLIAKVLAYESKANFISADAADLTSMWYGESGKRIKRMFRLAKENKPSIIFLDEFDAIAGIRDGVNEATQRMINQFLIELDGIDELKGTLVLAATNRYDIIDPAIIRPGRFDAKIEIPLPDYESRLQILKIHTKKMNLSSDFVLENIIEKMDGFSGADIKGLCNDAAYSSIRRYLDENGSNILELDKKHYEKIKITEDDFYKFL